MKEITFLKTNSEKWQQFEMLLNAKAISNPDTLGDYFIQLTDDLSYARTHYPSSNTTKYLNQLAARVHQEIYKNKKERKSRILYFWKYELPFVFKNSHRQLLYSFLISVIAFGIGWTSTVNDDSFVNIILGDSYVNMTLDNIDKGDPMAVYKKMNQVDMFLGITLNNILVSFQAFVLGLAFSFGTAYVLFSNGVMLGAFLGFLFRQGVLAQASLSIWLHGTLEISAIIIAGCAGLTLGNSILFPGTYSRGVSFVRGAKQSLKIIIGLVPVFICAGFLESFVTRYTRMPLWLSLFIIVASFVFIIGYFIVYPIILHKKTFHAATKN